MGRATRPPNALSAAAQNAGFPFVRSVFWNEAFHIGKVFASYFSCIGWLAIHRASFRASAGCLLLVVTAMLIPPFTPAVGVVAVPGDAITAMSPATVELALSFSTL